MLTDLCHWFWTMPGCANFSMTLQTSDFLKQIIFLKSFNSMFEVFSAVSSEKINCFSCAST